MRLVRDPLLGVVEIDARPPPPTAARRASDRLRRGRAGACDATASRWRSSACHSGNARKGVTPPSSQRRTRRGAPSGWSIDLGCLAWTQPREKQLVAGGRGRARRGRHDGGPRHRVDRRVPAAGARGARPVAALREHVGPHRDRGARRRPAGGAVRRRRTRSARLDIAIDGADQVADDGWIVKGGGGAHTREKLVAAAADRFVVIVSSDKLVDRVRPPIPLELHAYGLAATLRRLDLVHAARRPAEPRRRRDRRLPRRRRATPERLAAASAGDSRRRRPRPLPPGAGERGARRPRRPGRAPRAAALGSRSDDEGSDVATATPLQLGMVGLGRMGANLVRRAMRGRPSLRGVRRLAPTRLRQLAAEGASAAPTRSTSSWRCSSPRARSG